MSRKSFEALGASRPVVEALEAGGITDAVPVQSLVLPDALAGRESGGGDDQKGLGAR